MLDLGRLRQGSTPVGIVLTESNTASGPADLLAASLGSAGGAGFANAFGAVAGLGAGQSGAAGSVTLSTTDTGTFTETITGTPTRLERQRLRRRADGAGLDHHRDGHFQRGCGAAGAPTLALAPPQGGA